MTQVFSLLPSTKPVKLLFPSNTHIHVPHNHHASQLTPLHWSVHFAGAVALTALFQTVTAAASEPFCTHINTASLR